MSGRLKRNGYCSWIIEGPQRAVIVRRNGNLYQVFDEGGLMIDGFFHERFARKRDAISWAEERTKPG